MQHKSDFSQHARGEKTYLPLVVWTHVQVAQYDFWPDFLIKFLVRGPVISWPKIQLEDKNRLRCRMERHLLVKMLLTVSLGISGKQKIATAHVMRQFARWMSIFLIMKINNNILGAIRFKGNRILLLLLLLLMLPGATLIVRWLFFFLISMFRCSRTQWTCSKKKKQNKILTIEKYLKSIFVKEAVMTFSADKLSCQTQWLFYCGLKTCFFIQQHFEYIYILLKSYYYDVWYCVCCVESYGPHSVNKNGHNNLLTRIKS